MSGKYPDSLCLKCGRCCMGKVEIESRIYYTLEYCEHFNPVTRLCKIYQSRFEVCPECITIEEAIRLHALPNDCPYVKDLKDYEGVRPFSELIACYGSEIATMI